MTPLALKEHARLHACCTTLHRVADACAEELQRTALMVRGGPDAQADAAAWIARNPQAFADLVAVKLAMLTGDPVPARLLEREA